MLKKLLLPFLFVAFFVSQAMAQTGSITGTVTNDEGEPIPTANVLLVEAGLGDATNLEGEYTITDIPTGTYTLRVTFVGYADYTDQITIEAGETLQKDVTLQTSTIGLEELVVTGYGRKVGAQSTTGSIASIDVAEIENVPIATTAELFQGRAAGVTVQSQSGQPGAGISVTIRGSGSILAGSRPLYIVNGVQISFANNNGVISSNPLNFLDPDNIASIQILKDAAATAIYGAAGANGVVLITTKSGFDGPTRVTFTASRGYTEAADPLDLMNTKQWTDYFIRSIENLGLPTDFAKSFLLQNIIIPLGAPDPGEAEYGQLPYTDWIDFINRVGVNQKYSIRFAGGNDETTFYIAGSYNKTTGKIKTTRYERYALNVTLDHQVNDKFQLGTNISLASSFQRGTCEDGFFINCPTSAALFELPVTIPFTEEGDYSFETRFGFLGFAIPPLFNERRRTADIFSLVGNISAQYDISESFSLRYQAGMDYTTNRGRTYRSPVLNPAEGGTLFTNMQINTNFNTSLTLAYRETFSGNHNISGLAGVEYREDQQRNFGLNVNGFPGSLLDAASTAADVNDAFGYIREFVKLGTFVNVKYNYDERYYAQATARYDGSSRFGRENRYGFFPAGSIAWRVSEEDFYPSDALVNNLKFRVSYGITGNPLIGYYAALGLYEVGRNYDGVAGLFPDQLAKPRLTWEESAKLNIGVDLAMFDGRFDATVNVYQAVNSSLLLEKPLPATAGYEDITQNIGKVRNRGIEFIFNSTNIAAGDFLWTSTFNITYLRSEIIELTEGINTLFPGNILPYQVGRPLTAMKLIRWAGVNPADGRPMWYDSNGNIIYKPVFSDDAVFVDKTANADVVGGFGNTFSYKGLSLNVFFQYQFGGYALPQTAWFFGTAQITTTITNGRVVAFTRSWREAGDLVPIPKPLFGSTSYPGTFGWSRASSNAFFSTDYIRLKNITLSYSLPASISDGLNINNAMFYVSGYNLVTFTDYPGYDPEVPGPFPASSYPVGRRISAGVEVTF